MAQKKPQLQKPVDPTEIQDPTQSALSSYISKCYAEAKTAKTHIVQRLLSCERQRRGVYDPDKAALIRTTGGSDIYMMLTDIKCRAAESWIKDVMLSTGDKSWSLAPTKEPSVPNEMRTGVIEMVVSEAQHVMQQGTSVDPRTIDARLKEVHDEVVNAIRDKVEITCQNMENHMLDKLQDAKWGDTIKEVVYDFVTYPTCFIKGPVVRKKPVLAWGKGWKPEVTEELMQDFERVSPYDMFPSPNAISCQDGYMIQRHKLSRAALSAMIGTPGYNDEEIKLALIQFGSGGLRDIIQSDSERALLEGRQNSMLGTDVIEAIEFWGAVSGKMLQDWGMSDVDEYKEYQVDCWRIGSHVIRCVLNPDPLGKRPYSKASWDSIPGAFWGMALPEKMSDVQTMCNASARALANNMGIASGPQVEVAIDRLPDGENVTQIYPWKIWQTTSDRTGGGQPAVRFYQPNMNAETLMSVYQYFQKVSDEVTGVPNYVYGSSQVAGAGRTAAGLSMLMENAAKGIKQAILALDGAVSDMLERFYNHLMIYDQDTTIKGDMQVIASGVVATLMKEGVQQRRQEFMAATLNQFDAQIIGSAGRAYLLRETAKGLNLDVDKIIPSPEQMALIQQQQEAAAEQQQQQAEQMQQVQQHTAAAQAQQEVNKAAVPPEQQQQPVR